MSPQSAQPFCMPMTLIFLRLAKIFQPCLVLMNNQLALYTDWLIANKLSLNTAKPHFVLFRPGRTTFTNCPDLHMNNSLIERKESTLFLGVYLDSKLSWEDHLLHLKAKVAKNVGIIGRAKRLLNRFTLKTLYYTLVYPLLTYCLEVWGLAAISIA